MDGARAPCSVRARPTSRSIRFAVPIPQKIKSKGCVIANCSGGTLPLILGGKHAARSRSAHRRPISARMVGDRSRCSSRSHRPCRITFVQRSSSSSLACDSTGMNGCETLLCGKPISVLLLAHSPRTREFSLVWGLGLFLCLFEAGVDPMALARTKSFVRRPHFARSAMGSIGSIGDRSFSAWSRGMQTPARKNTPPRLTQRWVGKRSKVMQALGALRTNLGGLRIRMPRGLRR